MIDDPTIDDAVDYQQRARTMWTNSRWYIHDKAPKDDQIAWQDAAARRYRLARALVRTIGELVKWERSVVGALEPWACTQHVSGPWVISKEYLQGSVSTYKFVVYHDSYGLMFSAPLLTEARAYCESLCPDCVSDDRGLVTLCPYCDGPEMDYHTMCMDIPCENEFHTEQSVDNSAEIS